MGQNKLGVKKIVFNQVKGQDNLIKNTVYKYITLSNYNLALSEFEIHVIINQFVENQLK